MEVLKPEVEINPEMTVTELWIELKIEGYEVPSRSQFYEWLRYAKIVPFNRKRGGFKPPTQFTSVHLGILKRFAELKKEHGTLQAASDALSNETRQQ